MMSKFRYRLYVLVIALSLFTFGYEQESTVFVKGPYLQNVKPNSITIMWESAKPEIGKIEYGIGGVGEFEAVEPRLTKIHEITLVGLQPGTVYQYRAISGEAASGIYTFKTGGKKGSPFSFVAYGDNKNGPFNFLRIVELIRSKRPDFVIHNGDFVDRGKVKKQWQKLFFEPARKLIREIPLFPVIGNHEDHAQNYFDYFSVPNNELWYSFNYGNAHFIVLDTESDSLKKGAAEYRWLIEDLRRKQATWTFVATHHPLFTAGGNYYANDRIYLKNLLHPIFEKYGVDMVLSGHDHNYERSFPIMSHNGKRPVTYVVCGNGGTPLRYIGHREWTLHTERVFGFVRIHIDGSKLHYQAYNINDEVIDEFTLDKNDPASVAAYTQNAVFFEDIHDPVIATKKYRAGRRLRKHGKYAEALPLFQEAYQADSTCIEALRGMARCYLEIGKVDTAVSLAKLAIHKKPNYPKSYEVLVNALIEKEKYDEALTWCDKWARVEPDHPDPLQTEAEIYEELRKFDQAIACLQAAIHILPSDADLYFDLGKLYEKAGRRRKAIAAYEKGLEWFMDQEENKDAIAAREALKRLRND